LIAPLIYFLGDVHGNYGHVIDAVERDAPDAVIFLGDLAAQRPLHEVLAPILTKTVVRFIHGNHDTDTDEVFRNVFKSDVANLNLDGRVENICGVRIAGLGGVFRNRIWMPPAAPVFSSYRHYAEYLQRRRPPRGRSLQGDAPSRQERTQRSSIFHDVYATLARERADVLVTHEAPSSHPHGFAVLDEIARALGVKSAFHGHHHDCRDYYRAMWWSLGFRAYGVALCGIASLDGQIIRSGDFACTSDALNE
jgi:predicted phosphodiesterase